MSKSASSKIRLKTKDRLSLFTDLSTMLGAGIPILEAIDSLRTDSKGNLKKVLIHLHTALDNGESLSKALSRMPRSFDPVSINLVRAAEVGGTLETTLHDIVVVTKKEMAFTDQLRNTIIYPVFVMIVFMGIVVLMLTFVIPRIAKVFGTLNVKMPWITKKMIEASAFFISHWLAIIIFVVIIIFLFTLLIIYNKRFIVRILLSLPLLRTLGTNIDLAHFTRSFGLLLRSGVPIVESLSLSERVVQKKAIINVIRLMKADIEAGKPLSTSMRRSNKVIPMTMARSVETAERSGTLELTMRNLSEQFDDQVSSSLKILSSMVEPILLIVVGVMVGGLMITIIAPIYNMISQINPSQK